MSRFTLLFLNGAILTVGAVFIYPGKTTVLTGLLLLLPLLDRSWHRPVFTREKKQAGIIIGLLIVYALIVFLHPQHRYTALAILFMVALPEEWFFRGYLMSRVEAYLSSKNMQHIRADWLANITTSILFALLHIPTQGLFGLSVFFPSLIFGWVYQRYNNLLIVIVLHAISNLIFIIYFHKLLNEIMGYS